MKMSNERNWNTVPVNRPDYIKKPRIYIPPRYRSIPERISRVATKHISPCYKESFRATLGDGTLTLYDQSQGKRLVMGGFGDVFIEPEGTFDFRKADITFSFCYSFRTSFSVDAPFESWHSPFPSEDDGTKFIYLFERDLKEYFPNAKAQWMDRWLGIGICRIQIDIGRV